MSVPNHGPKFFKAQNIFNTQSPPIFLRLLSSLISSVNSRTDRAKLQLQPDCARATQASTHRSLSLPQTNDRACMYPAMPLPPCLFGYVMFDSRDARRVAFKNSRSVANRHFVWSPTARFISGHTSVRRTAGYLIKVSVSIFFSIVYRSLHHAESNLPKTS